MAENCEFKIKLSDNTTKVFKSEEDLNTFVRDNKRSLVASALSGKVIFSKQGDIVDQVKQELLVKNAGLKLRKADHVYLREKPNGVTEEGFTSVTQFISKPQDLGNPAGKSYMVPEFRKDTYFQNLAAELIGAGLTQDFINQRIEELEKKWDTSSVAGTSLHDIGENFVLKRYADSSALKADYPNLTDEQAKMYWDTFKNLSNQIKAEHGDDAQFLPEFIVIDEQAKIVGTIDLLVIDNKGKMHIYDYKTSFKKLADWNQVKKNSVDYQLSTYKQILLRQGFDVGKTKYIPIKIDKYNEATDTVEEFTVEPTVDSTQTSRGNIILNLNLVLPYAFKPRTDFIADNKPVTEMLLKNFNYETRNATTNTGAAGNTAKQQLDYLLTNGKQFEDKKNGNRKFIFLPDIGGAKVNTRLYVDDPEVKNLQLVNAYLVQLQEYNSKLPTKITDYVNNARLYVNRGEHVDNKILWNTDDSTTAQYLNNLLGKYINSDEWAPFESDAMTDLGIVAFENQATHQVDFITMTGKTLKGDNGKPALVKNRKKLLGNVMSDDKSTTLGFYNDVTNGDIELLKIYAFIQNNQATFKDKKIGTLAAVQLRSNQTINTIATQTLSSIQKQYDALVKHGDDFELKGKTWKVDVQDNYESLVSFVKEMFGTDKGDKIVINKNGRAVRESLSMLDKITDNESKLQLLVNISNMLKGDLKDKNNMMAAPQEKQELVLLVANAILQLQNIDISFEDDAKRFGNIVGDNLMVNIPERIRHSLVKLNVNLVQTALNDVRHKFNSDIKGVNEMHTDFYKGVNATSYDIKLSGNNYKFFENLIEKKGDRYTWEFKSEDDPKLNKAEKKYIKEYLTRINAIRRAKLATAFGELSQQVEDFDDNPPRTIPLMKASGHSALHNKGMKAYFKDYVDSLANDTRVLETTDDEKDQLKFQTKMFNQFDRFDVDADARADYLDTHDDADLEIDLENVMHAYTMANAKQVVFDKALGTLNALKDVAMLSDNFYFRSLDNVESYMGMYIGAQFFGKKILAGENVTLAKFSAAASSVTSKLTLGLSVPTMLNETFNNAFMSISKVFGASIGKKQFSKDSWLSAERLVWTDKMGNNQLNLGKMNFNRHLNSMFSIVESDLGQLQHEGQSTSTALNRNFASNVTMKLNQLPNYAHRMSIFVAQMIEDGIIKTNGGKFADNSAMKLVGEELVYNPKLDDRFSLFLNSPNHFPVGKEDAWKESRSLYLTIKEAIEGEPDGIDPKTGLITRPYDNKVRDSLKSTADEIFGGYDPESKVMWTNTAFGQLFNQFKNWMWAKKSRIWSETDVNGRQGRRVWDKDLEEHVWKNDIMEGVGNSLYALVQDVKESRDLMASWDKLAPERKERIMWALSDLVLWALISGLAGFLLGELDKDEDPYAHTVAKSMKNATSDLAFWSAAGTVITPNNQIPMLGMINRVVQGTIGLTTGDHMATQQMLNSVGLYRTLNPVYRNIAEATSEDK